eukprot:m.170297 g.170297  ORF g.170297 m.170297 type:complete len:67 (+) comp16684_c0_seq5:3665-3865(+)
MATPRMSRAKQVVQQLETMIEEADARRHKRQQDQLKEQRELQDKFASALLDKVAHCFEDIEKRLQK